jgi:hypothetical protein
LFCQPSFYHRHQWRFFWLILFSKRHSLLLRWMMVPHRQKIRRDTFDSALRDH